MTNFVENLKTCVWPIDPEFNCPWTNNSCESYNHVYKNYTDWKSIQEKDIFAPFGSIGSYYICSKYKSDVQICISTKNLLVKNVSTNSLTKLLSFLSPKTEIISKDGLLSIPYSHPILHKPSQRTREAYIYTRITETRSIPKN